MKKIISIILSLSLCMSCLSLLAAAEKNDSNIVTVSADDAMRMYEEYRSSAVSDDTAALSALSDTDFDEFKTNVYNNLKDHTYNNIDVTKYGYKVSSVIGADGKEYMTADELMKDYLKIVTSYPEFYYAKTGCGYSYDKTTHKISKVTPGYITEFNVNKEEKGKLDPKYTAEFESKANEIYNKVVQDGMSPEDMALAFYDYLANHIDYYYDIENAPATAFSAYGAMVNGSAVCQGYSLAYGYFMGQCGIDWKYVDSDEMNHAWNMVKLNNNWYHVDVTWGDDLHDNTGCITHQYFLKSDETFQSQDKHSGWSDSSEKCTDKTYESDSYPFCKLNQELTEPDFLGYQYETADCFLGRGTYTYNNGYFYIKYESHYSGGEPLNKYGKFSFNGGVDPNNPDKKFIAISREDYYAANPEPSETPAPTDTPEPTDTPVPYEKPDANSYEIKGLNYDEQANFLVSVQENIARSNTDKIIVATYDDDAQICSLSIADMNIVNNEDGIGIVTVANHLTQESAEKSTVLKIFIWDDFNHINVLAPLYEAIIKQQ